jgi:transposase
MSRRPRRNHTAAFKAKVALEASRGDKTVTEIAQQDDVHPNQVTEWAIERMSDVFGVGAAAAEPTIDVKALRVKIGQRTLENDFLEGALSKAGLLSAGR